jgi:radical SAM protein with 4Fe4S-binding SPASM domain
MINNSENISNTFCVLPWIHLNIQPNGDIYPCCMAPYGMPIGNTKDNTLEEIWNNEQMMSIRKDMLSGNRPKLTIFSMMVLMN